METEKRLFTERQVSVSALIGGPIPPGILIYKNLRRLDREKEAYMAMAGTLIFTVSLAFGMMSLPQEIFEKIPSQLISSLLGLVVWAVYRVSVGDLVQAGLESGSSKESNWKVAGVTILGILLYVVIAMGVGFSTPYFSGEKMDFQGNEVYYEEGVPVSDVEKLSSQLFAMEYFEVDDPGVVHIQTNGGTYEVTLPVHRDFWEDENVITQLMSLKILLQADFSRDVTIILEHFDLKGSRFTKSI